MCQPKRSLPKPAKCPSSCIPIPQLQPQQANASSQLTHYSTTCPPLTAPAHHLVYPCNSSYHQTFTQHLLHPTHWRFPAQQALTPHPQSQHLPASPATLTARAPAPAHAVALPPILLQEP